MKEGLFKSWSNINKKTEGQIELGFGLIGLALGVCAVLNMLALENKIIAFICGTALIIAGMYFAGLANKLRTERINEDNADKN